MNGFMKAIWPEGKLREKNYSCAFLLHCEGLTNTSVLRLAAENLYRVHVDGHFVGAGPVRCAHRKSCIDTFELNKYLNSKGQAWICIEVTAYNISVLSDVNDLPFFAAEVRDGEKILYTSDDFHAFGLCDVEQVVPRYSWQRHFLECYRMDRDRSSLYLGNTQGHTALRCVEVEGNELSERDVSYPLYEIKYADDLIETGRMVFNEYAPIYTDRYMHEISDNGFAYDSIKDSAIEAIRCFTYRRESPLGKPSYSLYDLGENLSGFINLELDVEDDACVYVLWDEVLDEDGYIAPLRMRMANTLRLRLRKGHYSFASMEAYTMRYIKVVTLSGNVFVKQMGLRKYENSNAWRLEFSCADKRYEKLVRAAQSTLAQNSTDIFMDCPSRERAGWLCDSYFMGDAEWLLAGENTVEKHFLNNYSECPQYPYYPEGMIPKTYPGESPLAQNFIPNWALWYIVELAAYFRRTHDKALVEKSRRIVDGLIGYFTKFENEYELLENLESWVFVEWSRANDFVDGVNFPSNMLYSKALSDVAELYGVSELLEKSKRIKQKIRELSLGRGLFYRDHAIRKDGKLCVCPERTETCQYYAFYFGVATPETDSGLIVELVNKFGYYRDIEKVYPDVYKSNAFIGNLMRLCYLSRSGYAEKAVKQAVDFYLYMVDKTGTLWEYDTCKKSCCHGFASYIATIMLRGLVGYDSRHQNVITFLDTHMNVDCTLKMPVGCDRYVTVTIEDGKRIISAPEDIEIKINESRKPDIHYPKLYIPLCSRAREGQYTHPCVISRTSNVQVISKIKKEDFDAYCDELRNKGYKEVSSNSFGKNVFVTFEGEINWLFLSYYAYCGELHVIADAPRPMWLYSSDYEVGSIKFAQYDTNTSYVNDTVGVACGMGYLFMLSDGNFIVIDGGVEGDADRFLKLMQDMSGEARPRVALWIITHPHSDHYGALKILSHTDNVEIRNYYSCMPPSDFKPQGCRDMLEGIKDYDLKNITAHTGDKFVIGGVQIESLLTCEEMILRKYEQTYTDTNNLSTVLKFTVSGQSILFAADARTPEYLVLEKVAGAVLKSDILQVTHHGRTGRAHEDAFVRAVSPTVALWPGNHAQIAHDCALGANNWIYSEESTVKEHIVANDGRFICELPYGKEH